MSREAKILIGILVIVVGAMVALFTLAGGGTATPEPAADASKLVRDTSHKTGTGSVQMVEFGDYQCPACGAAFPIIQQIMQDYSGKVTLVFRNYPLTSIHKNAMAGASAAEAAAMQNKFWEMHDKLYQTQNDWGESADPTTFFAGYAKDLGLDVDKFKQDSASAAVKKIIDDDKADGDALKIQATPTIYVNGNKAADYSAATLKDAIDNALKQ